MLGWAGVRLAAPSLAVDGCCVVAMDLMSTVSSGQGDTWSQTWSLSVLAGCVLRFLSKPCLSCYILMFLLLCSVAESIFS